MAKQETKSSIETEEKLRSLYRLQLINSAIDDIIRLRGALPLEVQNLEVDIDTISLNLTKLQEGIDALEIYIFERKNKITEAETILEKYKKQLDNVSNSREFDSLNNEIEYQELEVQLCEKQIGQTTRKIQERQEKIESINEELARKQQHLDDKKKELDIILKETEKEESDKRVKMDKIRKDLDEYLLAKYDRIRRHSSNGLAVVTIENDAAVGSFFILTPQIKIDVNARKSIVTDPYSGRILVDAALASEEKEKMKHKLV